MCLVVKRTIDVVVALGSAAKVVCSLIGRLPVLAGSE
jgi:hypothetical protein